MKKCVATCIYRSKTMVSFSVNCNGTIVILANKKKEYPQLYRAYRGLLGSA